MARAEKEAAVEALTAKLRQWEGVLVTDYRGLRVKDLGELRCQLRGAGAEYVVVKNTLMRRAAQAAGKARLSELLSGPSAILFTAQEAAPAVKALLAFARQYGLPQVRGVMLRDRLYPASAANDLATLPGREGMLALVIGGFQGPISSLASTLQAVVARLAATLQALAQKRELGAA